MNHTRRSGPLASATLLLLFMALRPLTAQECALAGNEQTNQAASHIQQAREAVAEEAKMSHYREALALLEQAAAAQPDDPATLWLSGELQMSMRDYALADSMFDRLVEVQPACRGRAEESRRRGWVELHNAGVRTYNSGDVAGALEALENAAILYEDARSYNVAGFIHRNQDEPEAAIELYRKAMEVAAEEEQLRIATISLAQLLVSTGSVQEALTVYSPYIAAHPDDMPALVDYAVVVATAGHPDSSRAIFSRLLARESQTYEEWFELGKGLLRVENYADAIKALEAARELEPYRKEAKPHLVDALIERERCAEAVPLADTLISWYPYDASNYSPLATCLGKLNRSAEALRILQVADKLPFEFVSEQLTSQRTNQYVLRVEVAGRSGGAGSTVTVPVEFLAADGAVVATGDLSLQVPSAGAVGLFQVTVESETPIAGYRYQRLEG